MMIRRISSILILTLILMMSIIVMPNMTQNASAGVLPLKVEITAAEATKNVNVGPGQNAFATFSFTVSSMGPNPLRQVMVSAVPDSSGGIIAATASPPQFVVSKNSPQTVTVAVAVSREVAAPLQSVVTLTAADETGVSTGGAAYVIINQFSFLVIDPVAPYQEIPPGSPFAYYFKVTNQGNGPEPVRFDVTNKNHLESEGWTVLVPPTQQIPMKQFVTVKVSGTTPRTWGWRSEFETITFRVISELKGVNYSQEYTVTVFLRGFFVPAFDPMFTIIAIAVVAGVISNNKNKKSSPDFDSEDGEELNDVSEKLDESCGKDSDQGTAENLEIPKTHLDT